jgi:endopolyphosphatase
MKIGPSANSVSRYNISQIDNDEYFADVVKKRKGGHRHHLPKDDCSRPENEDKPHCVFRTLPRYYDKNSPSRKNGPLSPLGYTQFYLPDVNSHKETPPEWKIEYSTFKPEKIVWNETAEGGQPGPVPMKFIHRWGEEEQGNVGLKERVKRISPWGMQDLTIGSWVKLARQLVVKKKMWNQFEEFMWVLLESERVIC